jgi:hypothetical protein
MKSGLLESDALATADPTTTPPVPPINDGGDGGTADVPATVKPCINRESVAAWQIARLMPACHSAGASSDAARVSDASVEDPDERAQRAEALRGTV